MTNKMEFVAIDVETANANQASICQIGIVRYIDGELAEEWASLINPEEYFDSVHTNIHGITENDVINSPTFPDVADKVREFLSDSICAHHWIFDPVSIGKALEKYELPDFNANWLDTARVARRTWEEFARKGYSLPNVCKKIGYEFKHHDALEDAKASAHVLLAAIEKTGLDLDDWKKHVNQPINPTESAVITGDGNPEGNLFGEVIVFTGSLTTYRNKSEAANLARDIGCTVKKTVTKETTILVVGVPDAYKLAGKDKTANHQKAEKLKQEKGQDIEIITESDFEELIRKNIID